MLDFTEIKPLVDNIEGEVAAFKMVLQNCSDNNEDFVPMCVFYTDKDTKAMVVAGASGDTFLEKFLSLSEVMHLYRPIRASSVLIAMSTIMIHEQNEYKALAISALSDEHAWNIIMPYTVHGKDVTWLDDIAYINPVDREDADETGRDLFSMLYVFTHMEASGLTAEEILSYLAYKGAAIHQVNTNIRYISPELEQ